MFKTFIAAAFAFLSFSSVQAEPQYTNIPPNPNVQITTEAPVQTAPVQEIKKVPSTDRYIIKDDPGGSVSDFIQALQYAKTKGYKFKIDGYCASACTLILATPLKLDVCVTPKASFMFHQPFAMDGYGRIWHSIPFVVQAQAMWDNLFYKNYPEFVRKAIDKNGGVPNVYKGAKPSDMFKMGYEELKKDLPTCSE